MSTFVKGMCILIVLAVNCPSFKVLQINAEENANDDTKQLKKVNDNPAEDQSKHLNDLNLHEKADILMDDFRVEKADYQPMTLTEVSQSDSTKNFQLDDLKYQTNDQADTPRTPSPHAIWTRRVRVIISIFSTLKPLFLTLGVISAIRNGIYVIKKFRSDIFPRGKKVWMYVIQELSFITPFDYMIDFCPQERN